MRKVVLGEKRRKTHGEKKKENYDRNCVHYVVPIHHLTEYQLQHRQLCQKHILGSADIANLTEVEK